MSPATADKIESKVIESLEGTRFPSASLEILSGGTANFIYRARVSTRLDGGTEDVLVKHGEGYVASNPGFQLTTSRCRIEEKCLKALASLPGAGRGGSESPFHYVVRAPRCFHFDEANNTQVQEYLPGGTSLKTYALENHSSPTPDALRPQCNELGKSLGRWLRAFHDWGAQEPNLRAEVAKSSEMKQLKHMINFQWLLQRVDQYPSILKDAKAVFEEVKEMAAAELEDETQLQVIHGDFWTGNILLPNAPVQEGAETPVFVIDWEMSHLGTRNLDLGQMLAEMYELWLYKKITAGLWMMQGFSEGYGAVSEQFALRTAVQLGAHLVCFGTSVQGWGTPKQVEDVARVGRDVVVDAWQRNREWFEAGELACLFSQVE